MGRVLWEGKGRSRRRRRLVLLLHRLALSHCALLRSFERLIDTF
jgi:hypothetical protein